MNQGLLVVAVRAVSDIARGPGAGERLHVHIAIAVDISIPVEVPLQTLVDRTVAVVVLVVADLRGSGVAGVVGVVAVSRALDVASGLLALPNLVAQVAITVSVVVRVPDRGIHRILVLDAVTVVVQTVTDLGGTRVDVIVQVVAVGRVADVAGRLRAGVHVGRALAVAVTVSVAVPGGGVACISSVHGSVAVVVVAVADFLGVRVDGGLGVVAVVVVGDLRGRWEADQDELQWVAEAVTIGVEPAGLLVLHVRVGVVDLAVAVVVHMVADLVRARVNAGRSVVAVGLVEHVAGGLRAGLVRARGVAEAVLVVVRVERGRIDRVLVRRAIAVVVRTITVLGGTGVDVVATVVAVGGRHHIVRRLRTGRDRETAAVAILIAVEVPGREVRAGVLVDTAVAVVVDAIAGLGRTRMDAAIGVVAVCVDRDIPQRCLAGHGHCEVISVTIIVIVRVPGLGVRGIHVHRAIAVVVDVVADLIGCRVHPVVEVVAVGLGLDIAHGLIAAHLGLEGRTLVLAVAVRVAIRIPRDLVDDVLVVAVRETVAVVVDLVTDLLGQWVDAGVLVVTVATVANRIDVVGRRIDRTVLLLGITVAITVVVSEEQSFWTIGHNLSLAVGETVVDLAVAVVVETIAVLGVPGVDRRSVIVAVHVGRVAVVIAIPSLGVAGGEEQEGKDDKEIVVHDAFL